MKMLIGSIFCLGMVGFTIYKRKIYGLVPTIMTVVTLIIASIIFFGQFIGR